MTRSKEISGVPPATLATRGERLAFWINTYNVLVADSIAALGLRRSVWEVPDFFQRIACRVGGLAFTADEIEHGVLRGNRPSPLSMARPFAPDDARLVHAIVPTDPRIHFALNCGARSCPAVRTYDADQLDAQLNAATRAFITNEVTVDDDALVISEIFKWFRADFDACAGGLGGFLVRHLDAGTARRHILERGLDGLTYRPWDWRLAVPVPATEPWTGRA